MQGLNIGLFEIVGLKKVFSNYKKIFFFPKKCLNFENEQLTQKKCLPYVYLILDFKAKITYFGLFKTLGLKNCILK